MLISLRLAVYNSQGKWVHENYNSIWVNSPCHCNIQCRLSIYLHSSLGNSCASFILLPLSDGGLKLSTTVQKTLTKQRQCMRISRYYNFMGLDKVKAHINISRDLLYTYWSVSLEPMLDTSMSVGCTRFFMGVEVCGPSYLGKILRNAWKWVSYSCFNWAVTLVFPIMWEISNKNL